MGEAVRNAAVRYWSAVLEMDPLSATLLGVHDHDDRVPDPSEESEQTWRDLFEGLRSEVRAVDPSGLGRDDRVTRSLLLHGLDVAIEAVDLRLAELASDHMLGVHAELLTMAPLLTYPDPAHAEAALRRHEQVPRLLDAAFERFRAGRDRGRVPAACVLARSIHSLDTYLATDPSADPFLGAVLPEGWNGAPEWRERVLTQVRDVIRPAIRRYRDAIAEELAPAARPDGRAGWCHLPDGDALYAALVRQHTTLGRSAAELHELGRHHTEVVLPDEYRGLAGPVFGTDDLPAVFDRLRRDPALRHADAAEIVAVAEASVARATEAAPAWFGHLPTAPCRVRPVPDYLADDAPYAYYFPPAVDGSRPGTYFINTARPTEALRTEAESIAFHEAIPGHHLQISISQELDDLPEFQRHDGATAYVEGWGLYAERLADEMGLYSGDLDRLGMLTADSWRSARLVVDTGLHALGWSRGEAIDYLEARTPVPTDQITGEVDRYLAMPGQALSYKVGQLEILAQRERARSRLGGRFEVAGFHDVVLGSGAVTLPVLGNLVEAWVREQVLHPR